VTVCIATLFNWNYIKPDKTLEATKKVGLAVSDRMITIGDIEYQPSQQKVAHMTSRAVLMIAGDYTIHSQAIRTTQRQLAGVTNASAHSIATSYGQAIQSIKRKQAEDTFLGPLGLNTDTFLAQQKEMSEDSVRYLTDQMQGYEGSEIEALIVGADDDGDAHIYLVDSKGSAHCFDDVGFAAIGIGAWHAKSLLMQAGYTNTTFYAQAVALAFAAKKAAEVAPGVGLHTDLSLVFKTGVEPVHHRVANRVDELHKEYVQKVRQYGVDLIQSLNSELPLFAEKIKEDFKGNDRKDAQADAGASADAAAKEPPENEGQEEGFQQTVGNTSALTDGATQ
jgi:20S proteasome alpha/beta subunit